MDKDGLLKSVAETGYNVGFGAKKNFATHDIVQKVPGAIAGLSLIVGAYALIYEPLTSKCIGATVLALGIVGLYVTQYDHKKDNYSKEGERLTVLFNKLRDLYRDVSSMENGDDLTAYRKRFDALQADFFSQGETKQILFSDWYAHYKFFWQHQIEWIDEQKKFKLLRDKVPLSFTLTILVAACAAIGWAVGRGALLTLPC